jgi:hypothetical protein
LVGGGENFKRYCKNKLDAGSATPNISTVINKKTCTNLKNNIDEAKSYTKSSAVVKMLHLCYTYINKKASKSTDLEAFLVLRPGVEPG